MAAKKPEPESKELPAPEYPAIVKYIEGASPELIATTFQSIKDELSGLKGPRAEQGKKVGKAIEKTEELLSYLLQVREKLEADRKGKGGARK